MSAPAGTSIRQAVRRIAFALLGTIGLTAVAALVGGLANLQAITNLSQTLSAAHDQLMPLIQHTRRLQLGVVEIQQQLTDIIATQGKSDTDDNAERVRQDAVRCKEELQAAQKLARELRLDAVAALLDKANRDLPDYVTAGTRMIEAYHRGGAAEGNGLMESFDSLADGINVDLEKAIGLVDQQVDTDGKAAEIAAATARRSAIVVVAVILLLGIVAAAVSVVVIRRIGATAETVGHAAEIIGRASRGDLNARVIRIQRQDEIGQLLHNVNRVLDLTEAFAKEAGAAMLYAGRKDYFRTIPEEGMRGEFLTYVRRINEVIAGMERRDQETVRFSRENVEPIARLVSDCSAGLRDSAQSMAGIAHQTIERSMVVASAAEQATANVQSVASAAVELNVSIEEINRQIGESSRLAGEAADEAQRTNATVTGLDEAARRIGDVVKLIHSIAGQTNLLALNATIEAARAGEAGKGFAVVAGEVKNLANQTAKATEDITAQVNTMQSISAETVQAILHINNLISRINENVVSVVEAVNAQSTATGEISRNVQEAAIGTQEVARNILAVTDGARETESRAGEVLSATGDLATKAETLRSDVEVFIGKVSGA